jgi:NitT/TauT family transport system permease protein
MMRRTLAASWPFLLLLALWQGWIALARVPVIVAPAPAAVAADLAAHAGTYAAEGGITLAVALAGLALGSLLAVAAAVLTWFFPAMSAPVAAPVLLAQATPVVAVVPVLARLLGYDERAVLAAAVLITVFPTFVLVSAGLRAVPAGASELFRALGARRPARLLLLALPSAVPNLLAALRIAAANCVLAALIAEYLMGTRGLGHLFASAAGELDTERAWGAALVATAISAGGYLAARQAERTLGRRFTA